MSSGGAVNPSTRMRGALVCAWRPLAPRSIVPARRPRASPLWQRVRRHLPELGASGRVRRAVEKKVLERFLDCGDPQRGFARIRCAGCGQDLLLAFSCKTGDFCPNCHQKRALAWGHWVEASVLRPVPHRQHAFTVPKLPRPFFACHRSLPGERRAPRALGRFARANPRGRMVAGAGSRRRAHRIEAVA